MSGIKKTAIDRFDDLCKLVERLRDPVSGCPWDLEQTHSTLAKYIIEEAYEAASAMTEHNMPHMCDELGDVLFQVLLNAQLASESKNFSIEDVLRNVHEKMVRRHPHVFGSEEDKKGREIPEIMKRWDEIKRAEKGEASTESYMEQKGVHRVHPASSQAYKIGKAAAFVRFDWDSADQVFDVLLSEVQEMKAEWQKSKKTLTPELSGEIGDVYFTLAQFCRHLKLEPEIVAMNANHKFLNRFRKMEEIAKARDQKISSLEQKEWEELWKQAKEET